MKDWLAQMQEPVEHYRDALKNISLYGTELTGFSGNNFDNIENASDYLSKRDEFIHSIKDMFRDEGVSGGDAEATADEYLSKYFKDVYDKYD